MEAAVRDQQVQLWMPVGARPMRLETGDNAHSELAFPGQRANRGRDGAGGHAGDLAEEARRYRQYARSRLGILSTTCQCGTGARSVVSSHCVQIARRLA